MTGMRRLDRETRAAILHLRLFQAATVDQLAGIIGRAKAGGAETDAASTLPVVEPSRPGPSAEPKDNTPGAAAKASFRKFYDKLTRYLDQSSAGVASFFLNYGYVSLGEGDEARLEVPDGAADPNPIRLTYELVGVMNLRARRVLDVGCGRGGTVALLADQFGADAMGIDLAPAAIAFCRRTHRQSNARFDVGDAEHLPVEDQSFDVVTNIESSHAYPNLRSFFVEVRRVLKADGVFLYTDFLPAQRWAEVRVFLASLGFKVLGDRDITSNVLASCDAVAAERAQAFGTANALIDNFLAVPGSAVYEQMRLAAWQYRILRARRA